jgi:hypothetical protein
MRADDLLARSVVSELAPDDLWGVWELASVKENFSDGQERLTSNMTGYLTYERHKAAVAIEFQHHIHLDAGGFGVSGGVVDHDFDLVLFSEWPRRRFQVRAALDNDTLTLRTSPATCRDGRTLCVAMTWERSSVAASSWAAATSVGSTREG